MVENSSKNLSGRLLNSTERQAIAKLMKLHQPMLNEMEKWKEHREKLETRLIDQIDKIGKILEPYYSQSQWQQTFAKVTGQQPRAKSPSKKTPAKKKSRAKKHDKY
jgi:hypothetical protein